MAAYSFYDATIVMAQGALTSLRGILSEAENHPNSATFFKARLIEDMKPLTFQVHYAAFQAQEIVAKLSSGSEYAEPEEENLDSYEKLHSLIDEALKALDRLDKETVNKIAETMTSSSKGAKDKEVPVKAMVGLMNMPNIYFHVIMAYAILRKEGVPLKKRNWSRAYVVDYI